VPTFGHSARATHDAQIAQVVGDVVVAAPWERRAFFVPATK
jgi:hypothetical protein